MALMVANDLAPGLLLAAPSLHDPNFEKTVVLLGRSGEEGRWAGSSTAAS
jgi:putative AlgH/UPF0301 family transcriptional regulator